MSSVFHLGDVDTTHSTADAVERARYKAEAVRLSLQRDQQEAVERRMKERQQQQQEPQEKGEDASSTSRDKADADAAETTKAAAETSSTPTTAMASSSASTPPASSSLSQPQRHEPPQTQTQTPAKSQTQQQPFSSSENRSDAFVREKLQLAQQEAVELQNRRASSTGVDSVEVLARQQQVRLKAERERERASRTSSSASSDDRANDYNNKTPGTTATTTATGADHDNNNAARAAVLPENKASVVNVVATAPETPPPPPKEQQQQAPLSAAAAAAKRDFGTGSVSTASASITKQVLSSSSLKHSGVPRYLAYRDSLKRLSGSFDMEEIEAKKIQSTLHAKERFDQVAKGIHDDNTGEDKLTSSLESYLDKQAFGATGVGAGVAAAPVIAAASTDEQKEVANAKGLPMPQDDIVMEKDQDRTPGEDQGGEVGKMQARQEGDDENLKVAAAATTIAAGTYSAAKIASPSENATTTAVSSPQRVVSFAGDDANKQQQIVYNEPQYDASESESSFHGTLTLQEYRRRNFLKCGLFVLFLIVFPLAVGLGVANPGRKTESNPVVSHNSTDADAPEATSPSVGTPAPASQSSSAPSTYLRFSFSPTVAPSESVQGDSRNSSATTPSLSPSASSATTYVPTASVAPAQDEPPTDAPTAPADTVSDAPSSIPTDSPTTKSPTTKSPTTKSPTTTPTTAPTTAPTTNPVSSPSVSPSPSPKPSKKPSTQAPVANVTEQNNITFEPVDSILDLWP